MKNRKKGEQIGNIQRRIGYSLLLITLPLIIVVMEASDSLAFSEESDVKCSEKGETLSGNIVTVVLGGDDVTFRIKGVDGCICKNAGGVTAGLSEMARRLNAFITLDSKLDAPEGKKEFIATYAKWSEIAQREWVKAIDLPDPKVIVRLPPGRRSETKFVDCYDHDEVRAFFRFYRQWSKHLARLLDDEDLHGTEFWQQNSKKFGESADPYKIEIGE